MSLRLFCCACALFCLPVSAWATQDLILTVNIRKKCAQFDGQSKNATRRSVIAPTMVHEGSQINALTLKGQIRKLHVTHLGTMGKQLETIYLENGNPTWVTRIESTYDAPLSGRVVKRVEEWLYFQNGKLIQRDLMPVSIIKGVSLIDRLWIHQTSITSPAQAREWKLKAAEWRARVTNYQRELAAKK